MTQHHTDFPPHRPMPAQRRRNWQALIVLAKERAEQWLRYQRALEEDSDETRAARAAHKAGYVAGFLAGVQQGSAVGVAKHRFCDDGTEPQHVQGGGG